MMLILGSALIGIVLGMTGAGGALVALPILKSLLEIDLKTASVLSLVVVSIAASAQFFLQRQRPAYSLASVMLIFSFPGSLLAKNLRSFFSESVLLMLLGVVVFSSLMMVWKKSENETIEEKTKALDYKSALTGCLLGLVNGLTGLGGGALLLPVLLRFFHLPFNTAVATSLGTVAVSSLLSFVILAEHISLPDWETWAELLAGLIISLLLTNKLMRAVPIQRLILIRKIIFTFTALGSMVLLG